MRWSQLYAPTLRSYPAEAEAPSHQRLVRAGFVRQLSAGHYSLLPLAVKVRQKIIEVIREEMTRIGAQECILPAMHPAEIWQESGRWDVMGDEMFRLTDRKGAAHALGMTHEEIFTTLAKELSSYRELPQLWYQFQTKFRDEPRPKSGLIRVREFTMKDSYSFDVDDSGLDTSFDKHREAYVRIFQRLKVPAIPVEASSGAMGGSASVEFMCPSESGEDLVVRCPDCGYAANMEKAKAAAPRFEDPPDSTLSPFDTPKVRTIADLHHQHGVTAERQIKTLVYMIDGQLTLVLLRGDHDLVEQKLGDVTAAMEFRPAHAEEIRAALGADPGSLGAVDVKHLPVIADETLQGRRDLTTGANTDGVHLSGVDVDRDLTVERWANLRQIYDGESCASCGGTLDVVRAIEVGHIFKLGSKYTEALGVTVLGPDGERVTPVMGSYGIGVERAMAAVIETHHDDAGILWPVSTAPFEAAVVVLNGDDPEVAAAAEGIYDQLSADRVEVVIDDRDMRPGAKFADVELVGLPYRVAVGKRGLKAGTAEVTTRATGETVAVPIAEAAEHVRKLVVGDRA